MCAVVEGAKKLAWINPGMANMNRRVIDVEIAEIVFYDLCLSDRARSSVVVPVIKLKMKLIIFLQNKAQNWIIRSRTKANTRSDCLVAFGCEKCFVAEELI